MINPVGSSLSALAAFQKKIDVTANNIANVLTDDFKKSRTTITEGNPNGVDAVVGRVDTPGIPKTTIRNDTLTTVESSNVDLAEELPELMLAKSAYRANLKTLKIQDDMMGSLLDIFS